jgi:hypothetical protein
MATAAQGAAVCSSSPAPRRARSLAPKAGSAQANPTQATKVLAMPAHDPKSRQVRIVVALRGRIMCGPRQLICWLGKRNRAIDASKLSARSN